jgi:hypothetical protein
MWSWLNSQSIYILSIMCFGYRPFKVARNKFIFEKIDFKWYIKDFFYLILKWWIYYLKQNWILKYV